MLRIPEDLLEQAHLRERCACFAADFRRGRNRHPVGRARSRAVVVLDGRVAERGTGSGSGQGGGPTDRPFHGRTIHRGTRAPCEPRVVAYLRRFRPLLEPVRGRLSQRSTAPPLPAGETCPKRAGRLGIELGRGRAGDLRIRFRVDRGAAAYHLAANRQPRHLSKPVIRPAQRSETRWPAAKLRNWSKNPDAFRGTIAG